MSNGFKTSLKDLAAEWTRKVGMPEEVTDLPPPDGSRTADVGSDGHTATQDSAALEFAGDMRAAAEDILLHPALSIKQREIWKAYLDTSGNVTLTSQETGYSVHQVYKYVNATKKLMVTPAQLAKEKAPSERKPHVLVPIDDFIDIEATMEIAVKTAHRVIRAVAEKPALDTEDIEANDGALKTLIAFRKSELEYLKKGGGGAWESKSDKDTELKRLAEGKPLNGDGGDE